MTTSEAASHGDIASQTKRQAVDAMLTQALARNGGGRAWREWKRKSIQPVLDLIARSPRMDLMELSLEGDLQAVFNIRCPVPRWPKDGRLVIGDRVVCHLLYQDQWRFESPPGWAPIGILWPHDLFHSNMLPHVRGALCLGGLPPNSQPLQIVLAAFDALTLQSINTDETDPQGILNPAASEFYRRHSAEYLPLTRAGLLDPVDLDPERTSP